VESASCVACQWRDRKLSGFIKNISICAPKLNKSLTGSERHEEPRVNPCRHKKNMRNSAETVNPNSGYNQGAWSCEVATLHLKTNKQINKQTNK
ncbi:hypothetical protein AMELA_G00006610, partial [Ameiurus melas]